MPGVRAKSGDVVIAKRSAAGAAPYPLYRLTENLGTGLFAGVPGLS